MACYFGCATIANKIAYTVYLLLVVVALVLVASWGISTSQCVTGLETDPSCTVLQNVTSTPNITITDATDLDQALGEACEELGFDISTQEYQDCKDCLTVASNCFISSWPLLVSAIVLGVLSVLPCFYCCCCSGNPSSAYEKNKL
mmetsp:Transcript_18660/g.52099  ORF Transcript_18660/g.52099 Transcript_18660/m.52099 type:complete len:145 (+) Transcript_18660:296-730(+)